VVEDEDHPVLGTQPVERPCDRVVLDELVHRGSSALVLRRLGLRGSARVGRTDGHLPKSNTVSERHQRGVRNDPVEPAVERRGIPEPRQLPPGGYERILGGIGRVGVVGQDRPGEAVAAIDPRVDEDLEGRLVAGASPPNERVVCRRRTVRCPRHRIHVALGSSIVALAWSRCRQSIGTCLVSRCRRGDDGWVVQ
jgi:hypothetical protein